MKQYLGSSAIFYFLVAASFIILFLAVPYPHYNDSTGGWFLGTSIGGRLLGNKTSGIPLEKVIISVTEASVKSPLSLECTSNEDCKEYVALNQCQVYCGNLLEANSSAIAQLNNQRVCDPSGWARPKVDCKCISGRCLSLE